MAADTQIDIELDDVHEQRESRRTLRGYARCQKNVCRQL
jgi:hypothetical protein